MKLNKKQLKKLIEEEFKKAFKENSNPIKKEKVEEGNSPATPEVKPDVKPSTPAPSQPKHDPFKENPKIREKPMPKAIGKQSSLKEFAERIAKHERQEVLNKRMISEAPLNVDDSPLGNPDQSIKAGIEGRRETPFTSVELFKKQNLDQTTLEKMGSEEYNEIIKDVMESGKLSPMELSNIANMIVFLEQSHRSALEQLALKTVKESFGISDSVIEKISAKILNPGEVSPPEDESDSGEEELMDDFTEEEKSIIRKHVDKRKVQNALMMGAGYRAHNVLSKIKSSLDSIEPKLYPLYIKFMPNVEMMMWKMPIDMPVSARMMGGKSELVMGEDEDQDGLREVKGAKAEAIMFAILLHEVSKAVTEYIFAYGLPKISEKVDKEILKQADSFKDEHWMKLIGPRIWKYLHDLIDYIVHEREDDYTIVSMLLYKLGRLEPENFLNLIDNVLHDGPAAISELKSMLDQIDSDMSDYQENNDGEIPSPEDIILGQSHEDEIKNTISSNIDNLLNGLEEKPDVSGKSLEDMEITELNNELEIALDNEDYIRAAKIRDLINR